jgi:hypothetical protein
MPASAEGIRAAAGRECVWRHVHHALVLADRVMERKAAAIIDSQSVRMSIKRGGKGYNAGKKTTGRRPNPAEKSSEAVQAEGHLLRAGLA